MSKRFVESLSLNNRPNRRRQARQSSLNVEVLEDRRLLATFTVTNVNDGGSGSLRDAIEMANTQPGADEITFDAATFSTPQTIALTQGHLYVSESLTITGSGQDLVTIDAQGNSRLLRFGATTGDLSLSGLTLQNGGSVSRGGGIYTRDGRVTLTNSTLSGNRTTGFLSNGGGIYTTSGSVSLTDSTLIGNSTSGSSARGGGISTRSGAVTLTRSTLSGNSTTGDRADGGGIYSQRGAVTLTGSTLSGNSTSGLRSTGGGFVAGSGPVTLTNSTISGNSTTGFGARGGGISVGNSTVTIINSTVTGNFASMAAGGGVIFVSSSANKTLTIDNSIVTGNMDDGTAPDLSPALNGSVTISYSLIGVADNFGTVTGNVGNQTGTAATPLDPQLGPLADNGGPTETHALLPGSPAIDAASNALAVSLNGWPLVKDQLGFSRVVDGDNDGTSTVDMGAYEFGGTSPLLLPLLTSIARDEGGLLARPDLLSTFTVSFDVDVSISADDLVIRNDTLGGTVVDSSGLVLDYDTITHTAMWDFTGLTLDPAFYSFELSDDIVSVDGNLSLDGNFDGNPGGVFVESVYVARPGDANLDGQVDVLGDAALLVNNLGTPTGAAWAEGDFNGDGAVDVLGDAAILVNRLGDSVVPLTTGSPSTQMLAASSTWRTLPASSFTSHQPPVASPAAAAELTLAGSQDLDEAFESNGLIDDGLFS